MQETSRNLPIPPGVALPNDLEELPLPYIELDSRGTITRANRAALALHPPGQGELVGTPAWQWMATGEREPSHADYLLLMETAADPPIVHRSICTRSGQFRTFAMHRRLLRIPGGEPVGMSVICVDVTDSNRALQESNRSRAWLESAIESFADALIITDALGFIRTANPAAERLFGWNPGEMLGKIIEKALPILCFQSSNGALLNFNMALEKPCRGLATLLDSQRREIHVDISTSPILDKASGFTEGVVSILRQTDPTG
jgi:PAS domain S-box-containing protein